MARPDKARSPRGPKPNTFDPRSRSSTLRAAKIRARKFGTTYMWPTAWAGYSIQGRSPSFNQSHIRIDKDGTVTRHGTLPARVASVHAVARPGSR